MLLTVQTPINSWYDLPFPAIGRPFLHLSFIWLCICVLYPWFLGGRKRLQLFKVGSWTKLGSCQLCAHAGRAFARPAWMLAMEARMARSMASLAMESLEGCQLTKDRLPRQLNLNHQTRWPNDSVRSLWSIIILHIIVFCWITDWRQTVCIVDHYCICYFDC